MQYLDFSGDMPPILYPAYCADHLCAEVYDIFIDEEEEDFTPFKISDEEGKRYIIEMDFN